MTLHIRVLLSLLLTVGLCPAAGMSAVDFMLVEEIEPGMTGYGLSVFKGADPERFEVEVIDIMENALQPQGDLILVRCSGGPLEETGIIAGMSGSPVYIDDRLIGALAYGWLFSKSPIGGVTPIGEMFEALNRGLDAGPMSSGSPFRGGSSGPADLSEFHRRLQTYLTRDYEAPVYDPWAGDLFAGLADGQIAIPSYGGRQPSIYPAERLSSIPTPLVLTGMHGSAYDRLSRTVSSANFIPLRAGRSSASRKAGVKLVPGGALAVQLIGGDMDASAIGTVTYVDGDRVLAFGHPMFQAGTVNYPMATAYIDAVIPSLFSSSKLGSSVEVVGSIRQDRAAAVAGLIGGAVEPIELLVRLDIGPELKKSYAYSIARHSLISPGLIESALMNSLAAAEKLVGDYAVQVSVRVEMDSREPFVLEDYLSGYGFLPLSLAGQVTGLVNLLMNNYFSPANINRLVIDIGLEESIKVAKITSVRLNKTRFKPGETVRIKVQYQPYRSVPLETEVEIRLPDDLPAGRLVIQVADPVTLRRNDIRRAPQRYSPRDFNQLMKLLNEEVASNNIIVELSAPYIGVTLAGEELPSLPASAVSVFSDSPQMGESTLTRSSILLRSLVPIPYQVTGSKTYSIILEKDNE